MWSCSYEVMHHPCLWRRLRDRTDQAQDSPPAPGQAGVSVKLRVTATQAPTPSSASSFLCKRGLQVGVDSVGVGGGGAGPGPLYLVGGDLSFDESALGPALGCWQSFLLVAFSGSLVHGCRRSPAFASSGHRLIERGSGRGSSVILAQLVVRSLDTVGGGVPPTKWGRDDTPEHRREVQKER